MAVGVGVGGTARVGDGVMAGVVVIAGVGGGVGAVAVVGDDTVPIVGAEAVATPVAAGRVRSVTRPIRAASASENRF